MWPAKNTVLHSCTQENCHIFGVDVFLWVASHAFSCVWRRRYLTPDVAGVWSPRMDHWREYFPRSRHVVDRRNLYVDMSLVFVYQFPHKRPYQRDKYVPMIETNKLASVSGRYNSFRPHCADA